MKLNSSTTTDGSLGTTARALWRATGTREEDFGKPIIAIANSFTEFVPGHVHLKELGKLVAEERRVGSNSGLGGITLAARSGPDENQQGGVDRVDGDTGQAPGM